MTIQLIRLLSALIAGGIVMIIHEFPKAIIYNKMNSNQDKKRKRNIYKLHHYIDPIGLVLCVTNQAGFSKPYMYRIKDKKTNLILGITGFISLLVTFAISISFLRYGIGMGSNFAYSESIGIVELTLQCIVVYIALISLSMTIVNLFPISTFDMGLILAGVNPKKFYSIIRYDYIIKMMLILVILFQLLTSLSTFIMSILL
jgi:membrane-associated protease RseP (regulator of RpoE activity)